MQSSDSRKTVQVIDDTDRRLINLAQSYQPQTTRPYAELARQLNITEESVLARLRNLQNKGILSRYGAVFNHKKAGYSTLAALAVPDDEIDEVAAWITQLDCVNHNYEREHHYNLWFVLTAKSQSNILQTLKVIRRKFNYPLLDLPMEKSYFINLGFPI